MCADDLPERSIARAKAIRSGNSLRLEVQWTSNASFVSERVTRASVLTELESIGIFASVCRTESGGFARVLVAGRGLARRYLKVFWEKSLKTLKLTFLRKIMRNTVFFTFKNSLTEIFS